MINVFQPTLGADELDAIAEVFASNWLGHGPRTKAFEEQFAAHLGVDPGHVLFINSATSGLFLAAELLGLGPGDDVVMPSASFVAAGNAVASTGARPVFCDVDERTMNPTAAHIEQALTPDTKAVLVLHYGGLPGEIAAIAQLCRERGIQLIEDAACAVSSSVDGTACGTFGDVAMWSFDAMKVLVTGDGGMLYVRDTELALRAKRLAYHGLEQSSGFTAAKVSHRWWELNVKDFGRRIVGNDLTAAIGLVQLARLPELITRRRTNSELYDQLLTDTHGVLLPPQTPKGHTSSHYFYWIQLDPTIRDHVAADLLKEGIYTTFRYPPLHKIPAYGPGHPELPGTEKSSENTLLLPQHPGLDTNDIHTIATALHTSIKHHTTPTHN
ncbi:DegT/DnrJ/EryC1/StrS family aminotransferase [Streptomyces poriticola]|uniref:DegT/DnrJ/EryC1/StrS family aminotransferase n=1 Tax=Streptomyces poriticola TaxID=3120506 RepID=UPI002FCE1AE4